MTLRPQCDFPLTRAGSYEEARRHSKAYQIESWENRIHGPQPQSLIPAAKKRNKDSQAGSPVA